MATYSDSILELAVASDVFHPVEMVASTATAIELLGLGLTLTASTAATMTSGVGGSQYADLHSTVTAVSTIAPSVRPAIALTSTATATSGVTLGYYQLVYANNGAAATNTVVPTVVVLRSALANVAVSESWAPSTKHAVAMADTITAMSAVRKGFAASWTDTVTASSAMIPGKAAYLTAANTVTVTSAVVPTTLARTALSSSASATSVAVHAAVTSAAFTDAVTAMSSVLFRDPMAPAWVMNTETTAMSRYEGFDFESVAQADGVLYGVNRDGIYAVRGDTDSGLKINATLEHGFLDLGTMLKKRIPYIYLGYAADGRLKLDINVLDRKATKATYYTAVLPAYQPVNTRMVLGKGLVGAYMKISLSNVLGSYFDLDKWEADVAVSTTRRMS